MPNRIRGEVVIRPVANFPFLCVLTTTHENIAGASIGIFTISDKSDVSSMLSSKKLVRPDKDHHHYNNYHCGHGRHCHRHINNITHITNIEILFY